MFNYIIKIQIKKCAALEVPDSDIWLHAHSSTLIMFLTHTRLLAQTQIFSHISFRKKGLETSQLVKRNVQKNREHICRL